MDTKQLIKNIVPNLYFKLLLLRTKKRFKNIKDPEEYFKKKYFKKFGVELDLDQPKTFYEKISYLKFNCEEKSPEQLIDKVLVKQYLIDKGYGSCFAKKIASFYSFNDFKQFYKTDLRQYKDFTVKTNHTSGDVFFYHNKKWYSKNGSRVSGRCVFLCMKNMLKMNYYHYAFEKIYDKVKPQILVEEFLPSLNNKGLDEFKFFCSYGKPLLINTVKGRQSGDEILEAFVDSDLKIINCSQTLKLLKQEEIVKPNCYEKMLEFCKNTVSDRKLIRVDLLTNGDEFYFCEFTFYDCSGMNIFKPNEMNYYLGDLFEI